LNGTYYLPLLSRVNYTVSLLPRIDESKIKLVFNGKRLLVERSCFSSTGGGTRERAMKKGAVRWVVGGTLA
jgi:hypothetical protein